jgi:hypothetical protein
MLCLLTAAIFALTLLAHEGMQQHATPSEFFCHYNIPGDEVISSVNK